MTYQIPLTAAISSFGCRSFFRVWPEYAGEPVTTKLIRLWRTSEYVIGTVTVNSTLN